MSRRSVGRRTIAAVMAAVAASTPAMAAQLTPADVERAVSIEDDALELIATLTTRDVFREKRGLLRRVPFDAFLRAFIDKKSGRVLYQLYATFIYTAPRYAYWTLANYETADGPVAAKLDVIARRRECAGRSDCARLETVGFPVAERVLREVAAAYRAGVGATWRFKLKAKAGVDHDDGLAGAEIAGLLNAVDAYRTAHGLDIGTRR